MPRSYPSEFREVLEETLKTYVYERSLKIGGVVDAGTVYVGTVETLILPEDSSRIDLALYNSGPGTLYIGPSGSTYYPILPNEQLAMTFKGALYGSADQADTLVRYLALKV